MTSIPKTMLAWQLTGAGLERFGVKDKPARLPVPAYNANELLMKVEAIGLCFSDVKLIKAGEQHPRVVVEGLAETPVIPGHEAVLTVVGVGKNLESRFKVGQRYIIQADIYYHGINLAYGYAIDGGMAQYSVMTEPVIEGDEGCYLLPISDKLAAAEAALIEPWTCVIAAYRIAARTGLATGGSVHIVGDGTESDHTLKGLLLRTNPPKHLIVSRLAGNLLEEIEMFGQSVGIPVEHREGTAGTADDLIVVGRHSTEDIRRLAAQLKKNGVFCLAGPYTGCEVMLDVGRIHYENWRYVGTTGLELAAAYEANTRSTLLPGGSVWFPGGAGAMGQMHVQLALEQDQPPRKIVVTDIDIARMAKLVARLQRKADEKRISLVTFNPHTFENNDAFHARLLEEASGGFDDIVVMVPSTALIADAMRLLGQNGVMNIFAGIPAGSGAVLDIGRIASAGHRYVGSSGSGMNDIRYTLELTEAGKLSPVYALAAVGGMNALKEGIAGVMNARFAGKTVIYPHAVEMPLVAVEELGTICSEAGARLGNGELLTREAEDALRAKWEKATAP